MKMVDEHASKYRISKIQAASALLLDDFLSKMKGWGS